MRTSLEHLSTKKQRDLTRVEEILFEEFRAAVAVRPPSIRKPAEILKIVLYGAYAKGGWVDEPRSKPNHRQSASNLLVVVNRKDLTDAIYWFDAEERIAWTTMETTPVSFIVHSLGEVNESLERGQCFFAEILAEGIGLYEKPGHPFRKPKPVAPAAVLVEARAAFDNWYPMAVVFARHSEQALGEGDL